MIKTSAAALLLSTALMTGAAMSQTSPNPTTDTSAPAATASSAASSGTAAPAGSAQFLTEQDGHQFRASKFVGLGIYGQDNQRIGDVNEILIDGAGNAKAIVLGVGGFLGIGEKSVAVPFSAVEWVNERPASATAAGGGTAGGSSAGMNTSPPAGGSASAGMGTAGTVGSTAGGSMGTGTGTTASRDASVTGSTNAAPVRPPADVAAANGYPDHGKVRMSKADLQNAPTFKYYGEARSNATTGTNAASGTAPRQ